MQNPEDGVEYTLRAIPVAEVAALAALLLRRQAPEVREHLARLPATKQREIMMRIYCDARLAIEHEIARAHGFESGTEASWIADPSVPRIVMGHPGLS